MGNRFDKLREKIKRIDPVEEPVVITNTIEDILSSIVDEIEKLHQELRQGYTKVEE